MVQPEHDVGIESPSGDARSPTPATRGRLRRPEGETVGTGTTVGLGCLVATLLAALILAAVFLLPYLR